MALYLVRFSMYSQVYTHKYYLCKLILTSMI